MSDYETVSSCELLSNHYLCANKNSLSKVQTSLFLVVNCFQIIIFVLTRTALKRLNVFGYRCELLSNHYLCANKNSLDEDGRDASML